MTFAHQATPAAVLLLADHLDAVLAAGEDIMKLKVDIEQVRKSDGAAAPWDRFNHLIASARLYELTIVSRVLQARTRAREVALALRREPHPFGPMLELFASGTTSLEDAVADLANRVGADFDAGLDTMAYLRTRGMLPAETGTIAGIRSVQVDETFLVARRIELGPLLDMAAALLDALDLVYGLFDEGEEERDHRAETSLISQEDAPPLHPAEP